MAKASSLVVGGWSSCHLTLDSLKLLRLQLYGQYDDESE